MKEVLESKMMMMIIIIIKDKNVLLRTHHISRKDLHVFCIPCLS